MNSSRSEIYFQTLRLIMIIMLFSFGAFGCGGGDGGGDSGNDSSNDNHQDINNSKTLGPSGGRIELMNGVFIELPPGAITDEIEFSARLSSINSEWGDFLEAREGYEITPSIYFKKPIKITLPEPNATSIWSISDDPVTLIDKHKITDRNPSEITFVTDHLTFFYTDEEDLQVRGKEPDELFEIKTSADDNYIYIQAKLNSDLINIGGVNLPLSAMSIENNMFYVKDAIENCPGYIHGAPEVEGCLDLIWAVEIVRDGIIDIPLARTMVVSRFSGLRRDYYKYDPIGKVAVSLFDTYEIGVGKPFNQFMKSGNMDLKDLFTVMSGEYFIARFPRSIANDQEGSYLSNLSIRFHNWVSFKGGFPSYVRLSWETESFNSFETVDIPAENRLTLPQNLSDPETRIMSSHDADIYLLEAGAGLLNLESEPQTPLYTIPLVGGTKIDISGNYLYVVEGEEMTVLDITNISDIRALGSCKIILNPIDNVESIKADGNFVYILFGLNQKLGVANVEDPFNPYYYEKEIEQPNCIMYLQSDKIDSLDGYVYAGGGTPLLRVIDYKDKLNPSVIYEYDYLSEKKNVYVKTVKVAYPYLFVGVSFNDSSLHTCSDEILTFYIENKANPSLISVKDYCEPRVISYDTNYLYVGGGNFSVYDISTISNPVLSGSIFGLFAPFVKYGDKVFFFDDRITVVDISNYMTPRVIGYGDYSPHASSSYVKNKGQYAFISTSRGISIYDLDNIDLSPRLDYDQDGYIFDEDCNDFRDDVYPGAEERCGDFIDQDCDGSDLTCQDDVDDDHDGYTENNGDCNDMDLTIYPGAPETCDGKDNQCPGDIGYGNVDEGCESCFDIDNDGYFSDPGCGTLVDCNDIDITIYPGAPEICDGKDNQCAGDTGYDVVDEECNSTGINIFLGTYSGTINITKVDDGGDTSLIGDHNFSISLFDLFQLNQTTYSFSFSLKEIISNDFVSQTSDTAVLYYGNSQFSDGDFYFSYYEGDGHEDNFALQGIIRSNGQLYVYIYDERYEGGRYMGFNSLLYKQ